MAFQGRSMEWQGLNMARYIMGTSRMEMKLRRKKAAITWQNAHAVTCSDLGQSNCLGTHVKCYTDQVDEGHLMDNNITEDVLAPFGKMDRWLSRSSRWPTNSTQSPYTAPLSSQAPLNLSCSSMTYSSPVSCLSIIVLPQQTSLTISHPSHNPFLMRSLPSATSSQASLTGLKAVSCLT